MTALRLSGDGLAPRVVRRNAGSRASVFYEAEDFQAALSADGVAGLLVTGHGQFRARVTQVELDRLRLTAVHEAQPRIAS
jgi:hypothetical protein